MKPKEEAKKEAKEEAKPKTVAKPPELAKSDAPLPVHQIPVVTETPKAGGSGEAEGVRLAKTIKMKDGVCSGSAICVDKVVWTSDQKGNVVIRERENASKTLSNVPTGHFVRCMLHIEPNIMFMGQEQGIYVFDTRKNADKKPKLELTGGHGGEVKCLAIDDGEFEVEEGEKVPRRTLWSGSSDFGIRQWGLEVWEKKHKPDHIVKAKPDFQHDFGPWALGVYIERKMHGHTLGVRALLKIGGMLWSGSDDGSIKIWQCKGKSQECVETITAHKGSVLKLTVVKSFVWSCGLDGIFKEWPIDGGDEGEARTCIRQVQPKAFSKGAYAMVPLGFDVWVCGHHPSIQVFSQRYLESRSELDAHDPYVSNLLRVDRIEARILWSSSEADGTVKVWRHLARGDIPSMDELKAANRVFRAKEQEIMKGLSKLVRQVTGLEDELAFQEEERRRQIGEMEKELAELLEGEGKLKQELEEQTQRVKKLETELARIRQAFKDAGLERFLDDPESLMKFLNQMSALRDLLQDLGLENLLDDPEAFRKMLEQFLGLKKVLEDNGFGNCVDDPTNLIEVLSHYNALKKAFENPGFLDLFEDAFTLDFWFKNYGKIREVFRDAGLEHLLDDPIAMAEFLKRNKQGQSELDPLREKAKRLLEVEAELDALRKQIAAAKEEVDQLNGRLQAYLAIGDLDSLRKYKADADEVGKYMDEQQEKAKIIADLKQQIDDLERERLDALERERLMKLRYKELDVFKLDIIGRELKKVINGIDLVESSCKSLLNDCAKTEAQEMQRCGKEGQVMMGHLADMDGHVRDVIHKCFSEIQKKHIGIATDDYKAAGKLESGGKMAGHVYTDADAPDDPAPDYGLSKAAKLYQQDHMQFERKASKD